MSPYRFAGGTEGWQCVLRAPSGESRHDIALDNSATRLTNPLSAVPGGPLWEFKGYGVRKPFARDEACYWFNRENGWVTS